VSTKKKEKKKLCYSSCVDDTHNRRKLII